MARHQGLIRHENPATRTRRRHHRGAVARDRPHDEARNGRARLAGIGALYTRLRDWTSGVPRACRRCDGRRGHDGSGTLATAGATSTACTSESASRLDRNLQPLPMARLRELLLEDALCGLPSAERPRRPTRLQVKPGTRVEVHLAFQPRRVVLSGARWSRRLQPSRVVSWSANRGGIILVAAVGDSGEAAYLVSLRILH